MNKSSRIISCISAFLLVLLLLSCSPTLSDNGTGKSVPLPTASQKAAFSIGKISFSPDPGIEGQPVYANVTISNTGKSEGVYVAEIMVDGKRINSREITIPPGDGTLVSFPLSPMKAGKYEVSLGDSKTTLKIGKTVKIAFCSIRADTGGTSQGTTYVTPNIFISNLSGGGQTNVTNTRQYNWFPDFSPDGSKICFESTREWHAQPRVYTMNSDGTEVALLTKENFWCQFPSWSPDGSLIAYTRNDLGVQAFTTVVPGNIWVTSPSGENPRMILQPATGVASCDRFVSWFPSSKSIAFESNREGFWQIYTMELDGTPSRVTELGNDCHAPAVSPDGKKIAYSSNGSIFLLDVSTRQSTKLTSPDMNATFPSWHPDGNLIIFTSGIKYNLHGWTLLGLYGIWSINSDGTGIKMIIPGGFLGRYQK
jgi:Tol biopolymer transport system component